MERLGFREGEWGKWGLGEGGWGDWGLRESGEIGIKVDI